jgi:hypothetical protein
MAMREHDVLDALNRRGFVRNEGGLPVKNGSIRTACPAKSSRKAEWPNQVMCMTTLIAGTPEYWNVRATIVARERIEKFAAGAAIAA